jgi:MOSC domain-containing protein YiiM
MKIRTKIKHLFCGKEQEINDGKRKAYKTSYKKKLVNSNNLLIISELGFTTDTQSDRSHHGGTDKAVCVYSQKYYPYFKEKYDLDLPLCSFGENLTIEDLDDSEVCLGDRFKYGDVILEVSQPRQPCWKISSVLGIKNLTALIVKESKTGFYFRVIKEGSIHKDNDLELISRDYPEITIEHINQCAFNAKENQENIKKILECDKLADAYRLSLSKRYKDKEQGVQDWQEDTYKS